MIIWGVVTHLCFGSELGQSKNFMKAAKDPWKESAAFSGKLKEGLQNGLSWPQARAFALNAELSYHEGTKDSKEIISLLETPNNLLGVEYCKALLRRGSSITPVTVRRKGNGYHSEDLDEKWLASAIRKGILQKPEQILLSSPRFRKKYSIFSGKSFLYRPMTCPTC